MLFNKQQRTTANDRRVSEWICVCVCVCCVLFVRVDSVKMDDGLCCYVQCISATLTIYILNFVYFPLNKLHFDSPSLMLMLCVCLCAWAVYIVIWNYQFFSLFFSHLVHFFSGFYYLLYLLSQVGHFVVYISIGFPTRTFTIFIFYALPVYKAYALRYGIFRPILCHSRFVRFMCMKNIYISSDDSRRFFPSDWHMEFISISFIISG